MLEFRELDDFQRAVGEWGDRIFGPIRGLDRRGDAALAHFRDEVEEFKRAHPDGQYQVEAADCFLMLLSYAYRRGFSLMDAAREKFEIIEGRQYGQPDERGVVRHVEATDAT